MADKIGVLGELTNAAVGTFVAYTVPTGKAARVKLSYFGQAGAGGTSTLSITVNGIVIFLTGAIGASTYIGSVRTQTYAILAGASWTGLTDITTQAPAVQEFYLSAADTVEYIIGTAAFQSMKFEVVGIEVDVV